MSEWYHKLPPEADLFFSKNELKQVERKITLGRLQCKFLKEAEQWEF
jgi:hypothetical protein